MTPPRLTLGELGWTFVSLVYVLRKDILGGLIIAGMIYGACVVLP